MTILYKRRRFSTSFYGISDGVTDAVWVGDVAVLELPHMKYSSINLGISGSGCHLKRDETSHHLSSPRSCSSTGFVVVIYYHYRWFPFFEIFWTSGGWHYELGATKQHRILGIARRHLIYLFLLLVVYGSLVKFPHRNRLISDFFETHTHILKYIYRCISKSMFVKLRGTHAN